MARILQQLSHVRCLKAFVEVDPSHPVFAQFRVSHGFYTEFAGNLLRDVLGAMPQVDFVHLDGNPSVQTDGPLVSRLKSEAEAQGNSVRWGKERGWFAPDTSAFQAGVRSNGLSDCAKKKQSPLEAPIRIDKALA